MLYAKDVASSSFIEFNLSKLVFLPVSTEVKFSRSDGDSAIYNHEGNLVNSSGQPFVECVLSHTTDSRIESMKYIPSTYSKEYMQYWASVIGIRSMDNIMGDKFPWIIGVSGGVDSAVVLALLVEAVGAKRVKAFNLPTRYNSAGTKGAAKKVCDALEVELQTISIEDLVSSQINCLETAGIQLSDVNKENIAAKIRGTSLLSNIGAALGGVMTNNGNKLKVALGYDSLYGDVDGAIAPIGDLLKVEVWNMAEFINEKYQKEVIPQELLPNDKFEISIPPSAELKSDQVDPMKWGYHDALLAYLLNYKRGSLDHLIESYKYDKTEFFSLLTKALPDKKVVDNLKQVMIKNNLYEYDEFIKDLKWFMGLMEWAIFKRIQSPPIVVQSKSSFGYDHRESQIRIDREIL
jgi:NAD+ synthase (glutamine-hydrolysing)